MLNLKSQIQILQKPRETYPERNDIITFDFVNNLEISSTWQNLSDTGSIIFPKNVSFRNQYGAVSSWAKQNVVIETGKNPPLIMRGDKIIIVLGYEYEVSAGNFQTITNKVFEGYITSINNRIPLELEFEDNTWLLKQIQAPNKTFKSTDYTLERMMKELLIGTPFSFQDNINGNKLSTTFGDFTTQNESIAEVLARLQKDFRFESNFKGNVLRTGMFVYYPEGRNTHNFKFQHNIISDDLVYKRKDDVKVGVEVHTTQLEPYKDGAKRKDGITKFKTVKYDYFGYYYKNELRIVQVDQKPKAFDGEIRTINMMKLPIDKIRDYIKTQLNRLTYEGSRGSFTTFGLPMVQHGDIVNLIDNVLPERNGRYMVKSVDTSFGVNGFRQEIGLDIKVDDYTDAELNAGL
jgi:hypothetical protein